MKENNIRDERIMTQRRKIQSDAYGILVYCLLASIIIQQFILHAPFAQFAAEFFSLIGIGIYMTIRYITMGIDVWISPAQSRKKLLINGVISGTIFIFLTVFLVGEKNILNMIISFFAFFAFYILSNLLLQYINKKRQKQIDNKLDNNEANE